MKLEDVYKTEGVPNRTYVEPPNYTELLIDLRSPYKPVIVEGQSGTGKTTTVKKILEREAELYSARYLTARLKQDIAEIAELVNNPKSGVYILDDFHRIPIDIQEKLGDLAKTSAEEGGRIGLPKLVFVGINQVGGGLLQLVPDLAKRFGIHRIVPADEHSTRKLVEAGETELNIKFDNPDAVYREAQGDYWLTQIICQTSCMIGNVLETIDGEPVKVCVDQEKVRSRIVTRLSAAYSLAAKEFCRGRRFRPSNDPYFKLLRAVAERGQGSVDLTMLANERQDIRASIISLKEGRLKVLLDAKRDVLRQFYYNQETTIFAVEDPALMYYLKHLDWVAFRSECGFKGGNAKDYAYDIALSFAGENRNLASYLADSLMDLDIGVFYDEYYENNFLGKALGTWFKKIFGEESRFVVVLLDTHHYNKIWTTFERDCFRFKVAEGTIIPVRLDDTVFPGIPNDTVSIMFKEEISQENWKDAATTKIVYRIIDRLAE